MRQRLIQTEKPSQEQTIFCPFRHETKFTSWEFRKLTSGSRMILLPGARRLEEPMRAKALARKAVLFVSTAGRTTPAVLACCGVMANRQTSNSVASLMLVSVETGELSSSAHGLPPPPTEAVNSPCPIRNLG